MEPVPFDLTAAHGAAESIGFLRQEVKALRRNEQNVNR